MHSDIKIAIIPDTNVFTYSEKRINDLSRLPLDEYYKILKTLELNDLTYEVNIFFPEIVLLELLHHFELKLTERCRDLEKFQTEFKNFEEIIITNDNLDIKKFCEKLKKSYFEELNIISIPDDEKALFKEILDMSVHKKPPFVEGDSDKCFKDAILFLSLLKFAEENKYDKYVLFTKDKGFSNNSHELQNIFSNHLKNFNNHDVYNNLEIKKSKNINSYIDEEFKLFTDLKDYIPNNFFKIIESNYDYASLVTIEDIEYDIDSFELIKDDTTIHQLDENEYEVEFFFYLWVYCPTDNFNVFDRFKTKTIIHSESYIFNKINGEWLFDLSSRYYDIEFDS